MVVWLCGCVVVWLCGCVVVCCSCSCVVVVLLSGGQPGGGPGESSPHGVLWLCVVVV